jgi:DNA-binding transcriptional ArsR family regulator
MVQRCNYSKTPKQAAKREGALDKTLDAALFKALGDKTRLLLLSCLAKCCRPCSVTEIAECCSVDLSVVSRHLLILSRAKIIEPSKVGRVVFYRVKYGRLSATLRAIAEAFDKYSVAVNEEGALNPDSHEIRGASKKRNH